MKKLQKYLLPAMIWIFVVVYVIWAVHLTKSAYSTTQVAGVEIEIVDSTADRRLVTDRMVREWIARSGIKVNDAVINDVNLQGIERIVANNGFVGKVAAYTAADGILRIEVGQRTPVFRFLADGYDRYVTADGFVFGTPTSSAIYVPVVTGSYRPQFPPEYQGYIEEYCNSLISGENGIQHKILALREQKNRLLEEQTKIKQQIEELKKERPRISKLDSGEKEEWKQHKIDEKNSEIRKKENQILHNTTEIEHLNDRMAAEQMTIKKTREKYEDFLKLLNFVEDLERDSFWQSEIVQIIADRSSSGILQLKLIPRSGSFVIDFGEIANVDAKLGKLMKFYREGLRNMGWDEFSVVSVAYKGQVVCKKKK